MTSALRATGRCGASTVMASCTRRGARLITTSCVSHKIITSHFPSPKPSSTNLISQILKDSSKWANQIATVSGKDLALMPYSSGTTGKPKGVALSHSAVASNVTMLVHPSVFTSHETTDSYQDSFLCYLPYFHVYGIVPMMMTGLQMGVKLVSTPKFDPNTFVKDIRQHKVGTLHLVPPVLNFLNHSPTVTPEALASLHTTFCGAAPVLVTDVQAFKERIKKTLFFQEAYGLTEALITHVTLKGRERIGRCGHLLPGVSSKVVDTLTGQTLPPDHNGEICVKTPAVSPSELEEVVLQHPKVVEVSVVGVPDSRIGEAPRAYVVTSAPTTQDEITKFVDSKVAPYKRLVGGVVFVREIPKSATGKVLRRELKKMALGTTSAAMT